MIKSNCSNESLYEYLYRIEPQKAIDFANTGKWPKDIQIPSNSNVLNKNWGNPVINGNKFSYDERSLPYVED